MPTKTASDLSAARNEKQDERREVLPTPYDDDEKRDLEKLSTSETANTTAENQEYFVTAKTWLVVWVRAY